MKRPGEPCPICGALVGVTCGMPNVHRGGCGRDCIGAFPWIALVDGEAHGVCPGSSCTRCARNRTIRADAIRWLLDHVRSPAVRAWVVGLDDGAAEARRALLRVLVARREVA